MAFLFLGVFTQGAVAFEGKDRGKRYPSSVLRLSPGGEVILVDKSRQRLFLYVSKNGNDLILEKTMICATGKAKGDKEVLGDNRTPEGIYFCKTILIPPNLGRKYGTCALTLNYPNPIDHIRHRNGGGIWIHGIREDRTVRSSRGCVVLENQDLVFLTQHVRLLYTPVIIVDRMRVVTETVRSEAADDVFRFLERWCAVRAGGDMEGYKSLYIPTFFTKGGLPAWWAKQKRLLQKNRGRCVVTVREPEILRVKGIAVVAFFEDLVTGDVTTKGLRRLYLKEVGGERKIVGEEWIPYSKVERKWAYYLETLPRLTLPKKAYRIFYPLSQVEMESKGRDSLAAELRGFLTAWKEAWESRDLARYMSFYAGRFTRDTMDLEAWRRYKSNRFGKGPISVTLKDVMVSRGRGEVALRFVQVYRCGAYEDRGIKVLVLRREAGSWKILKETWHRDS